jgi:3-methyladenine DNA glycosylase/8-oxoguanine DNA glycosylase
MTDLAEMHSYFWLTSYRLRKPLQDDVPYTTQALRQDLLRVRNAWDDCQANRDRDAINSYLSAVFDLVAWWAAENRAVSRGRWALKLQGLEVPTIDEPFAAIIRCTADQAKVDKRTRSKWSRVMRYAAEYKTNVEPLATFIQRKGGINKCADRFTRCLGRGRRN